MNTWLTDAPAAFDRFPEVNAPWQELDLAVAPPIICSLAARFMPGRPVYGMTGPSACSSRNSTTYFVLVEQAGESQFDQTVEGAKHDVDWPDRLVCQALTGSRFRGQRQRAWSVLRGNLHLTAHYHTKLDAATALSTLTMIPAVAAREAMLQVSAGKLNPYIKWVNDIWIGGKKVSGVLTATAITGTFVERVTFGIGMNIARAPDIVPDPVTPGAGCLAEFAPALKDHLPALFSEITEKLDELMRIVEAGARREIFARYCDGAGFLGRLVTIWPEELDNQSNHAPIARGRVVGLNEDLSLNMEGYNQPIRAGRMALS